MKDTSSTNTTNSARGKSSSAAAVQGIFRAISVLTDKKLAELRVDKTIGGRIISVVGAIYSVEIRGTVYTAVPSATDTAFAVGSSVWVTLPQGSWDDMFILARRQS